MWHTMFVHVLLEAQAGRLIRTVMEPTKLLALSALVSQSIDGMVKRNNPRNLGLFLQYTRKWIPQASAVGRKALFHRLIACILVLVRSAHEKRNISGKHRRRDSSTLDRRFDI